MEQPPPKPAQGTRSANVWSSIPSLDPPALDDPEGSDTVRITYLEVEVPSCLSDVDLSFELTDLHGFLFPPEQIQQFSLEPAFHMHLLIRKNISG